MDIEFHYYITYFIALRAGFKKDDAQVIAYAYCDTFAHQNFVGYFDAF